jgi:DNA topoisomerase-1
MSIGRVQGPALHLIVDKEKEIQKFKPAPYWQVFITINDGEKTLELKHNKDITKKQELEKFNKLKNKEVEASTKKTKQTITPPAPFDLTTLQTEAYKFHGITPSNALQSAQKLYLAGLISYPRTSSQKIPEEMKPNEILEQLKKRFPKLAQYTTRKKPVEGNKTDPAHPAIIPTGTFNKLEDYDEKIYNLIVKRFISCYCDNAELENKKVEVETEGLKFSARGMEILKAGWMDVYPVKMEEKEIKDFNGKVNIDKIKIEEKETQPPKRYSPASIISELEKRNLGTKATRANILETLYDRNYIREKNVEATQLGM